MTKAKILVVEDEIEVGSLIRKCLEKSGYEVVAVVTTASEAIAEARDRLPDLVLMDVNLSGGMDGVDASAKIRSDLTIPVIFLTGSADERTLERAKRTEPIGYLLKPFNAQILQTTIESALFHHHASTQRVRNIVENAEERFREMFENSPLGIYQATHSGKLLNANASLARILGYETVSELISSIRHSVSDIFEDSTICREFRESILQQNVVKAFESRFRHRNSAAVWVSLNARLIKDPNDNDVGYECIVQDITARKLAEDALRESEARLSCVVHAAQDGIVMMDHNSRVTLWSQATERITGYTAAEALGCNLNSLLCPSRFLSGYTDKYRQWLDSATGNSIGKIIELTVLRKDQSEFPAELSLSAVKENGCWISIGIIRDITERVRVQSERDRMEVMLRQAQKLESIGQLAAGIAHEINTPTQYVGDNTRFFKEAFSEVQNVLQSFARLLDACKEQTVTPELLEEVESQIQAADLQYLSAEIPKAVSQTLEGITRISTIVRAMKDFSHPGTKEKVPTDIHKAIESTLTVCRHEYKYVAETACQFDGSMPPVPCIPGEFTQVIMNLVINAAHAITAKIGSQPDSKGTITITTLRQGEWAEIRISDTGTGIPDSIRAKIYDPFFTTKEVGKGTGQGLAICHAVIVGKHDGTIDFESSEGKGTTFIIRLPIVVATKESEVA
jgi:two-component system, NtrC family, sensor kinase